MTAERWGWKRLDRKVIGEHVVMATRPCCGPDGTGPCLSVSEGLACGTAMRPTYETDAEAEARGRRLRDERFRGRVTLGDAADRTGLTVVQVGELERGLATVDDWTALRATILWPTAGELADACRRRAERLDETPAERAGGER